MKTRAENRASWKSRPNSNMSIFRLLLTLVSVSTFTPSDAFTISKSKNTVKSILHDGFSSGFKFHYGPKFLSKTTGLAATNDDSSNEINIQKDDNEGVTALPPIGTSSFWNRSNDNEAISQNFNNENNIIISSHHIVSPKFQLQYTCKICSTRNFHSVTRMAYRKGVVIAMCKGCESKHLIADNLGWSNYIGGFDFNNGETDIEKYMENRNEEMKLEMKKMGDGGKGDKGGEVAGVEEKEDLVLRVNENVFDLEKVLYVDQEENIFISAGDEDEDVESSWN